MKKFILLAGIAASISACNNESRDTTTVEADTISHTATAPGAYTPADGDLTYRDGKVMVWKNNEWVETDKDVTLDDGTVVHRDGKVEKDKKVVVLNDGEVVDKSGRFFDKAGNAIEDAWDATKEGAKETGEAVKKGAGKVGKEVKDVFKDDDKKDNQ